MQIIILGMHRSGTSALARLVAMMGASVGPSHLIGEPAGDNEKGFWERTDVSALNDSLLSSQGCTWDDPAGFDAERLDLDVLSGLVTQAKRILFQMDTRRPWLLKDPRLCLTMPFWKSLLEAPVCVLVYRSPLEVAHSLQVRNGLSLSQGVALWERYTLGALAASMGLPRLLISYAQLVQDPVATVGVLHQALSAAEVRGLHMPSEYEIKAFIEQRLRHHQAMLEEAAEFLNSAQQQLMAGMVDGSALNWSSLPALSQGASDLLDTVRAWRARDKESTQTLVQARAHQEAIQAELHRAVEAASAARHEADRARAEVSERDRQLVAVQASVAKSDDTLRALLQTLGMVHESRLNHLATEINEERAKTSQLGQNVTQALAELMPIVRSIHDSVSQQGQTHQTVATELRHIMEAMQSSAELGSLRQRVAELSGLLRTAENEAIGKDKLLWQQAGNLSLLARWLIDIDQSVSATRTSWRWRVGDRLVRGVERILFRPRPRLAMDHMIGVLSEFASWRRYQQIEGRDPTLGIPASVSRDAVVPVDVRDTEPALKMPATDSAYNPAPPVGSASTTRMPQEPSLPGYEVLCLPIIDWVFRFQRPQQLARRFVQAGHRVYYVGLNLGSDLLRHAIEPGVVGVTLPGRATLNVYRDTVSASEVEHMVGAIVELMAKAERMLGVCLVQLPFWGPVAEALRTRIGCRIVYDCMDDHADFSTNEPAMLAAETRLLQTADLVVASSQLLLDKVTPLAHRTLLVRNAVDYKHFASVGATHHAHANRLVVGYYGAIADWFDSDLVGQLARLRPHWRLILIGSTFNAHLAPLSGLTNISLTGEQPYTSLPQLIMDWDCCIIPFKRLPLTEATNPVKVYEMLAAGKPVVAVPLPELVPIAELGEIALAETAPAFAQAIEQAVAGDSLERQASRRAFARANTWELRYRDLDSGIRGLFPLVSVVVVTFNNHDLNRQCLLSLLSDTDYPNIEVIVVDNASSDGTPALLHHLAASDPRLRVILNSDNKGFAAANNQALAIARGDFLCLLNNDTLVTGAWLSTLVGHLQRHSNLGLVGPVTNAIGNEAQITVGYSEIAEMPAWASEYCRQQRGRLTDISMLAFFCVVMPRDVYATIGPLDERFGAGMFEDDDYNDRVRGAGFEVKLALDSFIHHWQRASFKLLGEDEYLRIYHENQRHYQEKKALSATKRAALEALRRRCETAPTVVLFPPSIGWHVDLFQRPHHLARALAARDSITIFDCTGSSVDQVELLHEIESNVYLFQGSATLLRDLPQPILWTFSYNYGYRDYFSSSARVVYDWIDDLTVFPYDQTWLSALHERALREADVVCAVARNLLDTLLVDRPDGLYVPNAVDADHFSEAPAPNPAQRDRAFKKVLAKGKPIAGYYGALARWFDYALLAQVAKLREDWSFVLIGPDLDGSFSASGISDLVNVHWLGPRHYDELPGYLHLFDAAMIPFQINEITLATSPLKLFEYFAGGRGVVTTPMPECAAFSEVLVANTAEAFADKLEKARALLGDPNYRARLAPLVAENTWMRRVDLVINALSGDV